jgi:hypothetical protein
VNEGVFPTFYLSGFECSTFQWLEQGRRDLVEETRHRAHAMADYERLRGLGIGVAREGVPWPMVDRGGRYEFASVDVFLEAMNRHRILPIWDLCHYGYPEDLDPFGPDFVHRFADYARAAAEYLVPKMRGPHCFTPINEISFFADMGGSWGWVAPFRKSPADHEAFRLKLCEADIAAVKAIREVEPKARMVHIDPLVLVVAPKDRPDLEDDARRETYYDTFVAWDVISGRQHPELGGSPEVLDIMGVNVYSFGQMELRENGPGAALPPGDERIRPLGELLAFAWNRYKRPMIVGETSGLGEGRSAWLKDITEEALAAVRQGLDLHGICLYPGVDMPNWHDGAWLHNGICDLVEDGDDLRREPCQAYVDELRRWQRRLKRVTELGELGEHPLSDPVDLQDIVDAAHRMPTETDVDWS